jgi:hypothetical protein
MSCELLKPFWKQILDAKQNCLGLKHYHCFHCFMGEREREREREREWIKRGLRILQYYCHCKCVDGNGYLYVFEFREGWEVFLNAIVEVS